MTTVEDIEKALSDLPAEELARFRAWFEAFEAARFDKRIEHDATSGKLDGFAEYAIPDFHKGRTREL
jgi:hypothetical protein